MKCAECGAIGRGTKCRFCDAPLTVPASSEDVDALARRAKATEKKLARAERREEIREELDDIDRSWEADRARLVFRKKDGTVVEPTRSGAIVAIALGLGGSLMVTVVSQQAVAMLAGLAMTAIVGTLSWSRATEYEQAENRWLARRDPLEEELAELRRHKKR